MWILIPWVWGGIWFCISNQLPSVLESVDWPLWGLMPLFFSVFLTSSTSFFAPWPYFLFCALPSYVCCVQWLSYIWLFWIIICFSHWVMSHSTSAWNEARQSSLSFTISWSLLKFMSIELVMLSNYLIPCCPFLPFVFNLSQHQSLFQWVGSLHQVAKTLEF